MAKSRLGRRVSSCLLSLATSGSLALSPAYADVRSIERALSGPQPPMIDPGPRNPPPFTGTIIIRFLPRDQVTAFCPRGMDFYSLACTDPKSRVVTMPDEASSGLSEEKWLLLLRHEVLHAQGLDWHGRR